MLCFFHDRDDPPACYRGLPGPSGPKCLRECPWECPRKPGCLRGCLTECLTECVRGPSGPGLHSVQKVSRECPRSIEKVFQTLRGHSRDTFWTLQSPGPEGLQRHSVRHSWRHPGFRGHSRGHSRRLRARRARETPVAGRRGRNTTLQSLFFSARKASNPRKRKQGPSSLPNP